ncbi:MAG: hypothetical protein EAZ32_13205 [Cytophagia bacterium]|nr:MAG: hypothetical protein EAZ38_14315 [Cytophagales bacterium]TAG38193.1 MAG: hypothetical protein EAZ32_13205 [Cytophagia bacterium]
MLNRNIFNSFFWLFLDKIIRSFGTFLINIQVILYLTIADYGLLSLAISFGQFAVVFTSFYREIAVKEFVVSNDKVNNIEVFLACLIIRFPMLFLVSTIQLVYSDNYIITLVVSSLILNWSDIPEFFWQAKGKVSNSIIIRNIVFLLAALFKLYFLIILKLPLAFYCTFLIESIVNSLLSFIIIFKYDLALHNINLSKVIERAKNIVKLSLPILPAGLLTIAYMRIDQIIIAKYLGEYELGKYAISINIVEILQAFPLILSLAVAPMIFQISDRKTLLIQIEKLMTNLFIAGIFLVISLILVFPAISFYLKVDQMNYIMIILAIGTLPTFLGYVATKYLIHTNQINHFLIRSLIATLFSSIINLILIKSFELYSTAVLYAISQWYICFFSNKFLTDKALYRAQVRAIKSSFKIKQYHSSYLSIKRIILQIWKPLF